MGRRIGVLGGTFNPIHLAHLIIAETAREQQKLDHILFMPAAIPPHKRDHEIADGKHRLEMVELAIAGNPSFSASDRELKRSGVSFTVDTLESLKAENSNAEYVWIIGADNVPDLPRWHRPLAILELAEIAVVQRLGSNLPPAGSLSPPFTPEQAERILTNVIVMPLLEISSSEIRRRCREGKSIRYWTPAAVEAYIRHHALYRNPNVDQR